MFGIHDFGVFLTTGIVLNLTPGPDTLYILGRGMAQGRGAGIASALGIGSESLVHTIAAALGLSALLATSASAFLAVKLMGAGYDPVYEIDHWRLDMRPHLRFLNLIGCSGRVVFYEDNHARAFCVSLRPVPKKRPPQRVHKYRLPDPALFLTRRSVHCPFEWRNPVPEIDSIMLPLMTMSGS